MFQQRCRAWQLEHSSCWKSIVKRRLEVIKSTTSRLKRHWWEGQQKSTQTSWRLTLKSMGAWVPELTTLLWAEPNMRYKCQCGHLKRKAEWFKGNLAASQCVVSTTDFLKMVLIFPNNNFWLITLIAVLIECADPERPPLGVQLPHQEGSHFQRINHISLGLLKIANLHTFTLADWASLASEWYRWQERTRREGIITYTNAELTHHAEWIGQLIFLSFFLFFPPSSSGSNSWKHRSSQYA